MRKTGTYATLIQGVSQQTPQQRTDGQLSEQINMTSDIVTGLRRRTGFKIQHDLNVSPLSKFDIVQLDGEYYVQVVEPTGRLVVARLSDMEILHDTVYPYLTNTSKGSIRSTISRNQSFILNTEKIPEKVVDYSNVVTPTSTEENTKFNWVTLGGTVSISGTRYESLRVVVPLAGIDVTVSAAYSGDGIKPVNYSADTRTTRLYNALLADSTISTNFTVNRRGTTIALLYNTANQPVTITYSWNVSTSGYTVVTSSQAFTRAQAPSDLPSTYNGYHFTRDGVQYVFDGTRKLWVVSGDLSTVLDPKGAGWFRVLSGTFSKDYTVAITQGSADPLTYTVTTSSSTAAQATAEYVATALYNQMVADTNFTARFDAYKSGIAVAVISKTANEQLVVEATGGDTYINSSGASILSNRSTLPPTLPQALDGYIQAVGVSTNLAYYQYDHSKRAWAECGAYELRYIIQNTPMFWYFDYDLGGLVVSTLDIKGRSAGDDNNNPEPSFINYGITGIGAYQSRLILLSGAYVSMSRSTDPTIFMRTTITEVLDDDAIEISATSLSNSQFEYAVPYNKDLVLFAGNQQAVIPNNSTVLTPKTAVIYPSTHTDVSLACAPTVIARSLYYTYIRGGDNTAYQVGELLPSPYTDSQYSTQSTTDHLPLYATGVCTCMSGSTAGNLAMFTNDTDEVLVNQFYWVGDERPLMAYHKWLLPDDLRVHYHTQVDDKIILLVSKEGTNGIYVVSTALQLNQLESKPVPYLDMYSYVSLDSTGVGELPDWYNDFLDSTSLTVVQYSNTDLRYMELQYSIADGQLVVPEGADETVVIGLKYYSGIELTPPFLRDKEGGVISGTRSTLQSLTFTFKDTSDFVYQVSDVYGTASSGDTSAPSWSEVDLGSTWTSDVTTFVIPCRVRLNSAKAVVSTTSTTDMNVLTVEYSVRIPDRDVRSRR